MPKGKIAKKRATPKDAGKSTKKRLASLKASAIGLTDWPNIEMNARQMTFPDRIK